MVRLKKYLGQHLLKDQAAVAAIRDALDPTPEDIVVEIGPGTGNLTAAIIDAPAKVLVLEKDPEMIESLYERFAEGIHHHKLEIIAGSALDFDPNVLNFYLKENLIASDTSTARSRVSVQDRPLGSHGQHHAQAFSHDTDRAVPGPGSAVSSLPTPTASPASGSPSNAGADVAIEPSGRDSGTRGLRTPEAGDDSSFFTYKLVGNVPYNITGALFEHFLSATVQPERLVFLIQKEVADRIMARDGKHSILSVSIHIYGTPRMVRKVPAGAFNPPPRVDSAIIAINDISRTAFIDADHESLFFHIVKTGFAHPRKFTISNLASFYERATLESVWASLGLDTKVRPEDLKVSQWLAISNALYQDPT